MRESIKEFAKLCAKTLPISDPVYEFGSLQVPGQENFADLRPFFSGKKFVGADMQEGPGVDVVLNLHQIDLPSESVGTVLILDTLEHVEYLRKAMEEAHRILKPNGMIIISSVMNFPIHDFPYDYWRFTPEAFKSLLKFFSSSIVDTSGESFFPHTVVGVGFKGLAPEKDTEEFKKRLKDWKKYWSNPFRYGWRMSVQQFIPPIIFSIYRKVKKLMNSKKITQ